MLRALLIASIALGPIAVWAGPVTSTRLSPEPGYEKWLRVERCLSDDDIEPTCVKVGILQRYDLKQTVRKLKSENFWKKMGFGVGAIAAVGITVVGGAYILTPYLITVGGAALAVGAPSVVSGVVSPIAGGVIGGAVGTFVVAGTNQLFSITEDIGNRSELIDSLTTAISSQATLEFIDSNGSAQLLLALLAESGIKDINIDVRYFVAPDRVP